MVFHPIRRTASIVANRAGGLLPHLFTLALLCSSGGCFLLRYYALASIFPLGRMVLYDARTLLSTLRGAAVERPADIERTMQ